MVTVIQSPDTYLAENRRNSVLNPVPVMNAAHVGGFGSGMTVSRVTFGPEQWFAVRADAATSNLGMWFQLGEAVPAGVRAAAAAEIRIETGATAREVLSRIIVGGLTAPNYVDRVVQLSATPTRVTAEVPSTVAGTLSDRLYVSAGSAQAGQTVYFRRVMQSPLGEYFDGSSAPVGDRSYSWTGVAFASPSIEWLRTPVVKVEPLVVNGLSVAREARSIVHTILGSSNPDVTFRPASLRRGTLKLVMPSAASAFAAQSGLLTPRTFDLVDTDVPQANMRFVVGDDEEVTVTLDPVARKSWIVEVPFREVAT